MANTISPAPTYADVILVDEKTKKPTFNPIWLRWFLDVSNQINNLPSTVGTVTSVGVSGGSTGLTTSGGPITTSGTITLTGTLAGVAGGTGISNSGKTITLGGNLVTSGAFSTTLTVTGATNVTLPTSGTLLAGNQNITLSGDVTGSGATSITTVLGNIPDGVTQAGSIIETNIAAPSSPASGHVKIWSDSTDLRFHDKNSAGTIGTTVVADTGAANNFLTAISAAGVISKARPSYANLSTGVSMKVGSFTIDVSTTGTQAVTGVGFKPRVLIFTSMIAAGTAIAIGIDDGTTAFLQATYDTVTVSNYTSNETQSIWGINDNTVANYNLSHVTSLDSDGFTITKTKTGTPTGTCTVHFLAIA